MGDQVKSVAVDIEKEIGDQQTGSIGEITEDIEEQRKLKEIISQKDQEKKEDDRFNMLFRIITEQNQL